jgi:hypothetical protein
LMLLALAGTAATTPSAAPTATAAAAQTLRFTLSLSVQECETSVEQKMINNCPRAGYMLANFASPGR